MSARVPDGGHRGTMRGVLLAASRDPDAKMIYLLTSPNVPSGPELVCKIPTTPSARSAVRHEAKTLVELRRMPLGALSGTIPRYVPASSMSLVGTGQLTPGSAPEMLVATQLRGRPMSRAYHQWRHTSRRPRVNADFDRALGWLESLWEATATPPGNRSRGQARSPKIFHGGGTAASSWAPHWIGYVPQRRTWPAMSVLAPRFTETSGSATCWWTRAR